MSADYLYPVEVVADMYLSKVGGFTSELEENEIGINMEALHENTALVSGVSKARIKVFDIPSKPFFLRKTYRIVGIEEDMESYELSKNGEVVFSEGEFKGIEEELEGRGVIINAVEDFRVRDMSKVVKAMRERIRNLDKFNI